jgi:small subunit ribosomal protein S3
MIERDIVSRRKTEYQIQEFISANLKGVGLSHTKIQRTPLGEKIVIYASRPGLIIGGGGTNIKKLTKLLKKNFGLENPQIEISEVENVNLVASVVAERIVSALEKFGTMRFK